MRKALNENPVVLISVIAALLLLAGVFMVPQLTKKEPAPEPSSVDVGVSVNGEEVGSVSLPATPPAAGAAAPTAPAQPSGTVTPEALIPGPGLPAEVVAAYESGKSVVLLLVRKSGIDDRKVRASVATLSKDRGLAVFVAPAHDVARYSRITQGVGVSRVPALVVIRPRSVGGDVPQAQVSYGFRDEQSIVQAVRDAVYTGKENRPYHPG